MERLDIIFKVSFTLFGSFTTYAFGGWSALLSILLAFVVLDYVTGIMAGYVQGKLSSKIGFKAIPKKIMIFVLVAVAHLIDSAIGENHMFRDATIFFYVANELISILENAGRIGLPLPEQLKNAVEVLKGRGK